MAQAHRTKKTVTTVTKQAKDSIGLTLGELREVIELADGLNDDANVTFEGLRIHSVWRDEHWAKRIWVREEL